MTEWQPIDLDDPRLNARFMAVKRAVEKMRATAADIPGLWNVPGYPELTTMQLLQVAGEPIPR